MFKKLKEELSKRIKNSEEHENLQRLYGADIRILFESIIAAEDIDDIAVQVKMRLANECFKKYRYQKALELLDDLLVNRDILYEQTLLEILEKKGIALVRTGKYEEAESIFKDMIESDVEWAKCKGMINLGITYYYLTKYTSKKYLNEAFELFMEAQKLLTPKFGGDQFQIYYNLALIIFEKGRFSECLKYLNSALEWADTEQQKAMVYNEIAQIMIVEFKLDEAEKYLDKAEKIVIKRTNYHELTLAWNLYIRGLWYKKKGEYTNSINYLELAVSTFIEKELFSEAAEVSYELYALNNFLESGEAEEYLADYQYYSRLIS
ncbi:MAG: hypothetical protein KAX49_07500 [Halanaerobiales bacterium]|nr:hypothetical protein [Halanaerobiales bacterium]